MEEISPAAVFGLWLCPLRAAQVCEACKSCKICKICEISKAVQPAKPARGNGLKLRLLHIKISLK